MNYYIKKCLLQIYHGSLEGYKHDKTHSLSGETYKYIIIIQRISTNKEAGTNTKGYTEDGYLTPSGEWTKVKGNLLRDLCLNWVFRGQAGIYQSKEEEEFQL